MENLSNGIKLSWYAFSQSEKHFQSNNIISPMALFDENGASLTITFLSLNRSALSIRLLDSIQKYIPNFKGKILIFDNGSNTDELNKLKSFVDTLKLSTTIFESKENFGVAGGRNRTADLITTDWFLSLDNDIYLVDNPLPAIKECIDNLGVHFLNIPLLSEDGYTVFTAGPNLYLEEYRDSYAIGTPTTFRQTLKSEINIETPFLSTCLFGGISVLRTASFIEQGKYDENMFIGFEDLDFSIRLYKKGIKIGNINKFCAIHGHEAPLNQSDLDYEKTRYSNKIILESAKYFHSKHNIYAWTEGVDAWLAAREKELELQNSTDFTRQIETHNRNIMKYSEKSLKDSSNLPRIALLIDSENWAFHNHAKQISKHLSHSYHFQIFASANYENPALLMLDVQDFDLIHFFWRADLYRLLDDWTRQFFSEKGWDYQGFITNIVAKANITTSVYDHLFLSESEIEERKVLFNALSVGYTTVSQRLLDIYSSIRFYPDAYGAIEDGVDLNFFTPRNLQRLADPNKEVVVGWVGNSKWGGDGVDHKGIETIIKPAIESLKEEGYNVRGFYADRQERWIPHSEMNDYYNSIDIYVCASDIEGTPNPALESMACGIPIVSTDVGMIPQLFGPLQKNYILPARSIEDLKAKLKKLIQNPQERELLSKENLERIKNWSWENQSQKWDDFFKEMLFVEQNKPMKASRDNLRQQYLNMFLDSSLARKTENNIVEMVENGQFLELLELSNQLKSKISLMEESKFWKIRGQWFKFKQKFGLSKGKY